MTALLKTLAAAPLSAITATETHVSLLTVGDEAKFPTISFPGADGSSVSDVRILAGTDKEWFHLLIAYQSTPDETPVAEQNQREIVRVWKTTGTRFDVLRGLYGTTAVAWSGGAGYTITATLVPTEHDLPSDTLRGVIKGSLDGSDPTAELGTVAARLKAVRGQEADLSVAVKVGSKQIRNEVLAGDEADNSGVVLLPDAPNSLTADERTLLTKKEQVQFSRVEVGSREVIPGVGAANYPIVGGLQGDLVHVLAFDAGGDIVLAAESTAAFGFIRSEQSGGDARITGAGEYNIGGNWWNIRTANRVGAQAQGFNLGNMSVKLSDGIYTAKFAAQSIIDTEEKLRNSLRDAAFGASADAATIDNPPFYGLLAARRALAHDLSLYGDFSRRAILQPLNKMDATDDPQGDASEGGANATPGLGFSVGSQWFNRTNKSRWICTLVSGEDATWERVGVQYQQIFSSSSGVSSGTHNLDYVNNNNGERWKFADFGMLTLLGRYNGRNHSAIIPAAKFTGGENIMVGTDGSLASTGAVGVTVTYGGASSFSLARHNAQNFVLRSIAGFY